MYVAFLDLETAYDAVDHKIMMRKLEEIGLEEEEIAILENLYKDCVTVYQLVPNKYSAATSFCSGGGSTLRFRCKGAPCLSEVSLREQEAQGINLTTKTTTGQSVETTITALASADDIALIAPSAEALQQMLNMCTEEAHKDGLKFNPSKSVWMAVQKRRRK
ncbi:uncharacterized protein LOC135373048 [Ornithodoros turicata]|uniref:uncharacterized protein LOC135373048 n=1 Tax=Ornithodoros turicata TaxID=34597 RepID=UPI00313987A3